MSTSNSPSEATRRSVAVAVFEGQAKARQAAQSLPQLGLSAQQVGVLGADSVDVRTVLLERGLAARGRDQPNVTGKWADVASRYEMLWQQHYGTTEATWEQMTPVYRWAWDVANAPQYRGRPWAEVESAVQREWEASAQPPLAWSAAAGPIRDVWEDVAEEAALGAEGRQYRIIPRQGTDQAVPARDLRPPA